MGKLVRLIIVIAIIVGVFMAFTRSDVAEKVIGAGSKGLGGAFDKFNEATGGNSTPGVVDASDRPYADTNKKSLEKLSNNIEKYSASSGYTRDKFGNGFNRVTNQNSIGWETFPNKKCDVRKAVLIDQGQNVTYDVNCRITGGTFTDYYGERNLSGNVEYYSSDVAKEFDIDHVVALSLAWRSGADKLNADMRNQIANDKANLMLSEAKINRAKGDQDVTTWTPPKNSKHYCDYMDRYAFIKSKYNLKVTQKEYDVVKGALNQCNNPQTETPTPAKK